MSVLSARMVDAAEEQDWDRLITLERSVSALNKTLASGNGNAGLTPEELALKATLIQRILDDDAEIRRHTEPWMEHVRQFLGGGARKRQVDQAYGAHRL
jgi:flagellar protein FliT